jgi:hypothetical protein
MSDLNVNSWEEFENALKQIRGEHKTRLLFRGQSDSSWGLRTTLERTSYGTEIPLSQTNHPPRHVRQAWSPSFAVKDYYQLISSIEPQIAATTGRHWDNVPAYEELRQIVNEYDPFSLRLSAGKLPAYGYLTYLRHHGFPSPLLDWTDSPYVAAYFAFQEPRHERKFVSIYILAEWLKGSKGRSSEGCIYSFGPIVESHKRHFLQKSSYTICVKFENGWYFTPHDTVFNMGRSDQDVLWKINIPAAERRKVLGILDEFNLNAFSLFGSEESLMETLALRNFSASEGRR